MHIPPRRSSVVTKLAAPLFAVAAALLGAAPSQVAWGGPTTAAARPAAVKVVNAEVMVLFATQVPGPGGIDPAIGNLPQLRKPPLSAYNTYRLLDKRSIPIQMGASSTYTLANGRVLQVSFVEPTADHGFHVRAAINQPGGNAYLKLLELTAKANDPFFVGGQSFNGGSILLAITLRP